MCDNAPVFVNKTTAARCCVSQFTMALITRTRTAVAVSRRRRRRTDLVSRHKLLTAAATALSFTTRSLGRRRRCGCALNFSKSLFEYLRGYSISGGVQRRLVRIRKKWRRHIYSYTRMYARRNLMILQNTICSSPSFCYTQTVYTYIICINAVQDI